MLQSSLAGWLKKPAATKENTQTPPPPPPPAAAAPRRPLPPPKAVSAPPRMPVNRVPSNTIPTPMPKATEQWNDIPDDFLSAPSSRPRSKKSPRPSATGTPASLSRVPTPLGLSSETTTETPSTATSTSPIPFPKSAIPSLFSLRPLPSNVQLAPLTPDHLDAFKRLNALTLPIPYPDSFYRETMTEPHHSITLIALWHPSPEGTADGPSNGSEKEDEKESNSSQTPKPRLIGAIRCRLLPSSQLYISTLGILAPYRSHGIAMHLLQSVVKTAVADHGVRCVTAHVWEANDDGLEWYKKRSFETLGKEDAYYRKLKPQGAFLMRKWIGVGDLLGGAEVR